MNVDHRRGCNRTIGAALTAGALLLGTINGAAALTVRVASPNGAPRLVVNGQPARARMFWGAPGAAPIPISNDWQEISFEFVASASATNGTMHFRFGHEPGTVELRALTVSELALGDWIVWPPNLAGNVQKTNGAVHVKLDAPADEHWPDFHIYSQPHLVIHAGQRYRVSFQARATPARSLTIGFYRPGQRYVHLGGPADVFESQIKLAASVGVNFVSFPIGTPWPRPGEAADWSDVDGPCETVLRANPNALLLPRIGMEPPAWWCAAHPDDVMQWDDGHRSHHGVPASPQYRRDAAERLAALVTHLEEKFGDHVAGYHPAGQNTGEWFYEATWKHPLNGYAPADRVAWHDWLQAHGKPEIDVPTAAERRSTNFFASAAVADWNQFQQEAMAGCVRELAHAARTASHGKKLVVFFYGYLFEFGPVANGPATSGHYALRRVLDCPDIDVLCSPISYFDRGLGQSAPSMTAAESVALAGKLWLNEDDTHTYLATGEQPGWREHVTTLADTNAELVRNVAQEAVRNFGTWWMDLGASGWFNDAAMWSEMQRLGAVDDIFLRNPTPYRPEIAVVIDEQALWRIAPGGVPATRRGICEVRAPLGRCGAPYGQFLLDDVVAGRVAAKLFVFLNAWNYTAADRDRLKQTVPGATLFVEAGELTSAALRDAARAAGVHLFTDTDCNVYASGRILALHASQDGPLTVNTGISGAVRDALSGAEVGQGPRFSLPIKRGETRVLRY